MEPKIDDKAAVMEVEDAAPPDQGRVRVGNDVFNQMSQRLEDFEDVNNRAHRATQYEQNLKFWEAIRLYPKATAYSMVFSLAIIMEGYDTSLLGSWFGYPTFQQKFGERQPDGTYQLTASWQSGLQAAVQVGEILGLWAGGSIAQHYGYKKTMLLALLIMTGAIFIMFFAQNLGMLFAGEVICGIPWGAFQTLTTTYAAEISPMPLRPFLTTYVNMCWVIGQLISAGVLRGFLERTDEWGWRIPYAIQWIWPIPIVIGVLLAPESPWWLVRQNRLGEVRKALQSLVIAKNSTEHSVEDQLAMIMHTNELERQHKEGTSYVDCFKGVDLRRTEITCMVWVIQISCGIWFGGNVIYFLEQAGFDPEKSFDFGLGHNGVGLFGTICAWWVMQYVGRRTLYLRGLEINFVILILVGLLGIPEPSESIAYATGTLLYVFTLTYSITVGPVCYCLVSELPSTRLRIRTVALSRNCYNILSIAANFLNNPILNPSAWNLRGKGGFVWCGFTLVSWIWTFFRLPETKGLSAGEMDILFEQKIKARDFRKVKADPFNHSIAGTSPDPAAMSQKSGSSHEQSSLGIKNDSL